MAPKRNLSKAQSSESQVTERAKRAPKVNTKKKGVLQARAVTKTTRPTARTRSSRVDSNENQHQEPIESATQPSNIPSEVFLREGPESHGGATSTTATSAVGNSSSPVAPSSQVTTITSDTDVISHVSSTLASNNTFTGMNTNNNPLLLISAAITETLKTVREAARNESDSRTGGRFVAAKSLPEFDGNPLDWIHFLESYRASTNLCGFSDRENIGRLHAALYGKAREAVRTLFATATSAEKIIETLELNFGNKHTVALKLIREIEEMPRLSTKELNLVQFADRLNNNVMALNSINMNGYLRDTKLLKNVANKLPETIKFAYCRHQSSLPPDASPLEKLIDFLHHEAQLAKEKGLVDLEPGNFDKSRDFYDYENTKKIKRKRHAEICANASQQNTQKRVKLNKAKKNCMFCERSNHEIIECRLFEDKSGRQRYDFAKRRGLCFGCLQNWNPQHSCEVRVTCDYCNGNHHNLLHFFKRDGTDIGKNSEQRAQMQCNVDNGKTKENSA